MKAINILWDVDYPDELDDLPAEVTIPQDLGDDEDAISDYLSDVTGFCHKGFQLVPESTKIEDIQRTLDLTINLGKDGFEIEVREPESGEVTRISHPYSFDGHPEFDKAIGAEIYSWLSLWKDELEDN